MIKKEVYILIIMLISFTLSAYAKEISFNEPIKGAKNASFLLNIWDSINYKSDNIKDPYKIETWERMFVLEYNNAVNANNIDLAFKLSIPLSYIYHSETKFSKGTPLLENIYAHKTNLPKRIYKDILVKLEQEYRAANNIEKAIQIRKERIANHYINNYWEIYKDCGLYEAAIKDLIQFQTIPAANTIARLQYYFLLGELYLDMKQYDSAKMIYIKALIESNQLIALTKKNKIINEDKLSFWESSFSGDIVKCNIEKGEFNNAIPILKNDINNSFQNSDNKADKMIVLSRCLINVKKFNLARAYLDSASKILSEKISKPIQQSFLLTNSEYYTAVNNIDSALFYYKSYNNYRDLLYKNIQKNQSILLLAQMEISNRRNELLESKQSLVDSNKKNDEQKNLLLILLFFLVTSITISTSIYLNSVANTKSKNKIEAQNIMINAHSEKIEAQFNHNETLLKELHHRVKNNLQVMYSLLNLQKRRNTDADTIETLSSIQNRIQTMALVHQNLYNSGDFEMVELLNYIKTLASHLESIYKIDKQKIVVKIEIEESLKLPIETVVAIGLIVNEAVSNSFKYAFKNSQNGTLLIKVLSNINEIAITIQDNGKGIQNEQKKEKSLGMKLINLMCLQLKATHTLETINGVTHHILFNQA